MAVASIAAPSVAKPGEVQVGGLVGLGLLEYSTVGPGGAVVASYGVFEWLDLDAVASITSLHAHPSDDFRTLLAPRLGPTFKLDISKWVPYVGVDTGLFAYVDDRPDRPGLPGRGRVSWGLGACYGVDYLYSRTLSITARIEHNVFFTAPSATTYHLFLGGVQVHFDI